MPELVPKPHELLAYSHLTACSPRKSCPCHLAYLPSSTLLRGCSQTARFSFHAVSAQSQGYEREVPNLPLQKGAGWEVSAGLRGVDRQQGWAWRWSETCSPPRTCLLSEHFLCEEWGWKLYRAALRHLHV